MSPWLQACGRFYLDSWLHVTEDVALLLNTSMYKRGVAVFVTEPSEASTPILAVFFC